MVFVVPRHEGKSGGQRLLRVAVLGDQCVSGVVEQVSNLLVDLVELFNGVAGGGLNNVLGLRDSDLLESDSGALLNILYEQLVLLRIEGDARAVSARSGRSARPVDVSLHVLRRLHLDNEVNIGDIEAAGGDIGGDEDVELTLLEALEGDLSLILGDVSVHNLDVLLDLVREQELVRFCLGRAEHDRLADTSVANKDVGQRADSVLPRTVYC